MSDYITIPYRFDYTINLGNDKQWNITQEDIRKNRIEGLLSFAASSKTLVERIMEDDKVYGEWLNAQKQQTNSLC